MRLADAARAPSALMAYYSRTCLIDSASGLSNALKALSGRGRLSEDNIADTVRQVRLALLDADVALPVVKSFTDAIKARAIGVEVTKSLTPGQAFIKVVHEELVRLMGEPSAGLNLRAQRPVVVMLAGLQGAGKTTTAGKLARWLIEKQNKKVLHGQHRRLSAGSDPAVADSRLSSGGGIRAGRSQEAPLAIARRALTEATLQAYDVLLLDTAGRLHIDAEMMTEVRELEAALHPHETAVRRRQHGGPGCRECRQGVQRGVELDRRDPHQGGRRCPRRGGVVGEAGDRQTDSLHRHGREIRRARAISARADRFAHPRDGRCPVAGRAGPGSGRPGKSREARQENQQGQVLRSVGSCAIN